MRQCNQGMNSQCICTNLGESSSKRILQLWIIFKQYHTISRAHLKNADSLCFLLFQDLSFGFFCVLTATKDSCDLYRCGRITVSFNHPKLKTSSCLDSALSLAIRGSAMLSSSLSSSSSSSSSCLGEWLDLSAKLTWLATSKICKLLRSLLALHGRQRKIWWNERAIPPRFSIVVYL